MKNLRKHKGGKRADRRSWRRRSRGKRESGGCEGGAVGLWVGRGALGRPWKRGGGGALAEIWRCGAVELGGSGIE